MPTTQPHDSLDFPMHRAPSRGETWACVKGAPEGSKRVVGEVLYSTVAGRPPCVVWASASSPHLVTTLDADFFVSWKRVGSVDDIPG